MGELSTSPMPCQPPAPAFGDTAGTLQGPKCLHWVFLVRFCGLCSSFNPFPGYASHWCHQEMSWLCAAAPTSIFLALSSGLGTGGDTGDGQGHHVLPGAQGHHVLLALGARRCLGHPECPQPCLSSVVSPGSSSWWGLTPSGQWHLGTAAADPEVSLGIEASGGKCTKNRGGENPGAGFTPQKKLPNNWT